jgi:hypothetical protein
MHIVVCAFFILLHLLMFFDYKFQLVGHKHKYATGAYFYGQLII